MDVSVDTTDVNDMNCHKEFFVITMEHVKWVCKRKDSNILGTCRAKLTLIMCGQWIENKVTQVRYEPKCLAEVKENISVNERNCYVVLWFSGVKQVRVYTGCFTTCEGYCRRWFPTSLWSKISYNHVSDIGRLRSYDSLNRRREGNDYWQ